jgi:putative membrane protein
MNENGNRQSRHFIGWAFLAVLIAAIVGFGVFGFFATGPYPGYYYPFTFFHRPFGVFFGLFWIFIIFWAVRWLFWPRRWGYWGGYYHYGHRDESYSILRQRYARGEITKEQFEQMMRDLREHS